jgi:hypothetical protein
MALVLGGFSILSAASVGMFLAPLALLLGLAASTVRQKGQTQMSHPSLNRP